MRINSSDKNITTEPLKMPLKRYNRPSFKSEFEINGDSISSRQQVFTLGMLMNNFWIRNARNTFFDVKRKYVSGKFNIYVNDLKDPIVERILTNNRIEYKKIDKKI